MWIHVDILRDLSKSKHIFHLNPWHDAEITGRFLGFPPQTPKSTCQSEVPCLRPGGLSSWQPKFRTSIPLPWRSPCSHAMFWWNDCEDQQGEQILWQNNMWCFEELCGFIAVAFLFTVLFVFVFKICNNTSRNVRCLWHDGALEGKHDILFWSQEYPIKVVVGFTQHIPCFFFALNGFSTTNWYKMYV